MFFEKRQFKRVVRKCVITTLFTAAAASAVLLGLNARIQNAENSIAERKKYAFFAEKEKDITQAMENDLARLIAPLEQIERALLSPDTMVEFVEALNALARANSLIQKLQFDSPIKTEYPSISRIEFTIQLNGNVFTLLQYVDQFEKLPYFAKMTRLAVQSPAPDGWKGDSSINLNGEVYIKTE